MVRLRWTRDSQFTDHARGFRATPTDREHDVDEDVAEEYLDHRSNGWERVGGDADTVDDGDESEDEDFDAAEFVDRTPMSEVTTDIRSGDYDDHLDEIEDAAERKGVLAAVDDRR